MLIDVNEQKNMLIDLWISRYAIGANKNASGQMSGEAHSKWNQSRTRIGDFFCQSLQEDENV